MDSASREKTCTTLFSSHLVVSWFCVSCNCLRSALSLKSGVSCRVIRGAKFCARLRSKFGIIKFSKHACLYHCVTASWILGWLTAVIDFISIRGELASALWWTDNIPPPLLLKRHRPRGEEHRNTGMLALSEVLHHDLRCGVPLDLEASQQDFRTIFLFHFDRGTPNVSAWTCWRRLQHTHALLHFCVRLRSDSSTTRSRCTRHECDPIFDHLRSNFQFGHHLSDLVEDLDGRLAHVDFVHLNCVGFPSIWNPFWVLRAVDELPNKVSSRPTHTGPLRKVCSEPNHLKDTLLIENARQFVHVQPIGSKVQLLETYENFVPFSASSFGIPWFFLNFFLDATGFPVTYFFVIMELQFQKIPMIPDFDLSRQVSPQLQPSTRHGTHLSAFLENSTLRRVLNFFLPSRQVSP